MINPVLNDKLFGLAEEAIALWGANSQFEMCREEMAELQLAMARKARNRSTHEDILEEAVDVYIMMTQLAVFYSPAAFNQMLEKKLVKFDSNLENFRK